MEVEAIFEEIAESKLLRALNQQGKLLFLGEEETVNYLQHFYENREQSCQYSYLTWTNGTMNFEPLNLSSYQAAIIVSIKDEHKIFDEFISYLHHKNLALPTYKLFSDIFVNLQAGCAILQSSELGTTPPEIAYAIVSTPRSGSTLLCNALVSTQIAGFPKEHLRPPSQILANYCQFNYVKYLQILATHKTTQNKVFGTKLIAQFLEGHLEAAYSFAPITSNYKFIYLYRRNKLSQAISIWLGIKTGIWHLETKQDLQCYQIKTKNIKIEDADVEKVRSLYKNLEKEEDYLNSFFRENQIAPLRVEYEKFVKFPAEYLEKILRYLGIIDETYSVKLVNRYQYKLFQIMKTKNLISKRQIFFKLKNKKVESSLKKEMMYQYKEKYGLVSVN